MSSGRSAREVARAVRFARRPIGQGFTLVETAIVLAVIGIVLVSVLQGRSMIANAEYKSFRNSLATHAEAFRIFRERYNALPGDFSEADERLGSDVASDGEQGNGVIDDGVSCSAATHESCLAWQHLRAAGLIGGDPTLTGTAAQPEHPYAGRFSAFFTGSQGNGEFGHKILIEGVPVEIARRIDEDIDDAQCNDGRVSARDTGNCTDGEWTSGEQVIDIIYAL